jgi:hypothetical protein
MLKDNNSEGKLYIQNTSSRVEIMELTSTAEIKLNSTLFVLLRL